MRVRERLNTKAVSEITGTPESTVAGWRHRNVGPEWFRIGGKVYYWEDQVRSWLEGQGATA